MKWTQLRVTCSVERLDQVTAVMSMLDNGLMIEDYSDIEETGFNAVYGELIDDELLNADKTKAAVSLYVPEVKNYNEYVLFIKERFATLDVPYEYELIGIDEEDWANSWKQYYKPVRIGENIVIVPEWEEYNAGDNEIIIRMDPGMAFGTGTHETTRLCVLLLERYLSAGSYVLDVGTGSGILAVTAMKLGAKSVFACDIDPTAIKVARENVILNGFSEITCEVSDLLKNVSGVYDLISANIVADIIIRMAPDVGKYLKTGGIVITSGIINTQAEEVRSVMESYGFAVIDTVTENDWVAYTFKKV